MTFPRIINILKVEPFKVTCLWNNEEIRLNDFTDKFDFFRQSERLKPLLDFYEFSQVFVSQGGTLSWENIRYTNTKGCSTPVTLDPDMLFKESSIL